MSLQGAIGIACMCIVLIIFFPWLILPIGIIWGLNMIAKASEAHDRYEKRRAEEPQEPETQQPFFATYPEEDIF